jgi:hypothetical protein
LSACLQYWANLQDRDQQSINLPDRAALTAISAHPHPHAPPQHADTAAPHPARIPHAHPPQTGNSQPQPDTCRQAPSPPPRPPPRADPPRMKYLARDTSASRCTPRQVHFSKTRAHPRSPIPLSIEEEYANQIIQRRDPAADTNATSSHTTSNANLKHTHRHRHTGTKGSGSA